jgi:hypothetical protein
MNLKDCYVTKMRWQDYEVGGRNYKAGFTESVVAKFKKEYADGGCGADPLLEECLSREQRIANVSNAVFISGQQNDMKSVELLSKDLQDSTKKFNDLGCPAKINEQKSVALQGKIKEYSSFDKERIEAESKYEARKKIFIGVSVILVAVALVVVIKSE